MESVCLGHHGGERGGGRTGWVQHSLPGHLDKNKMRPFIPQSFLILQGETDNATWGRSDQEAHLDGRSGRSLRLATSRR